MRSLVNVAAVVTLAGMFVAPPQDTDAASTVRVLRSVIRGTAGNDGIFGLVSVTESDDGTVKVEADVSGLPDGAHGFHVHTYGDAVGTSDGTSAGGHFNPNGVDHAGPDDSPRHVGDLGNIDSSGGSASYSREFAPDDASRPTIVSNFKNSIIGRSFVVHADADDLKTQPTGAAGARLAVGIVGIGNHELYNAETKTTTKAVEVTEHIDSDDFEDPAALVCNIVGDGVVGFGSAANGGDAMLGARVRGNGGGTHGFHVHWYGEEYDHQSGAAPNATVRDLARAGGHYNPTSVDHGLPPTDPRHFGDGGNITLNEEGDGFNKVQLPEGLSTLKYLVGRSCIVHADHDDGSQPSGNAGARIAAGQLGYANPDTCTDPAACLLPTTPTSASARALVSSVLAVTMIVGGSLVPALLGA